MNFLKFPVVLYVHILLITKILQHYLVRIKMNLLYMRRNVIKKKKEQHNGKSCFHKINLNIKESEKNIQSLKKVYNRLRRIKIKYFTYAKNKKKIINKIFWNFFLKKKIFFFNWEIFGGEKDAFREKWLTH